MKLTTLLAVLMLFLSLVQAQSNVSLPNEFDKILKEAYPADGPGCAALVAKGENIIYHKAFGMANMELGVPMKNDNVFRIGSITKQFTAVAILQLASKGKISLQDPITKFLPDYPTQGQNITVEHLLTHTSGIKSYTDMEEFDTIIKIDHKPEALVDFFKNQPMEFAPGTQWKYNNSGYFLLGIIIEKVSGMAYPEYLETQFFKPLGMTNSYYGSDLQLIKGRAAGYQPGKKGIENASAMSMTLPYAAGSIQSTVGDLWKWNRAVHSYKLVGKEWLDKAFTPYQLSTGEMTHYGYGWGISRVQGEPSIEHGGGINGFLTDAIYLPKQDVFVVVFSNSTGHSPDPEANKLAALAIGKPVSYKALAVPHTELADYPGVYESKSEQRIITLDSGNLHSQRTGGSKMLIQSFGKDQFFFENSMTTLEFKRGADNKVTEVISHEKDEDRVWKKTDKQANVRKPIKLPPADLGKYAGDYNLAPNFNIVITVEGERVFAQATGQQRFEIFAEAPDKFFPTVVDATIIFNCSGAGPCESLTLLQSGKELPAKRVQ